MRNFKLVDKLEVNGDSILEQCQAISVNYDTKDVYFGTNSTIYAVNSATKEVNSAVSPVVDGLPTGSSGIVGIQHLVDQMAVCVATTTGDVLLWHIGDTQVEGVGSVESGIKAMSWSPDQEILVLVTGEDRLVLMTRDFDPITEVEMNPSESPSESQFVNVGWGKKETQFHGSEGKEAARRKKELVAKPVRPWDDLRPRISWRGDGQYFVVSSVQPVGETRATRVLHTWTRDCQLFATSEVTEYGIEQSLAWKPTGMLIASSHLTDTQHEVVFFERSGLRHSEFALPFEAGSGKVRELLWNSESSVLCVWFEELPVESDKQIGDFVPKSWVQIWVTANYHWYLKQSLDFPGTADQSVAAVAWDPEQELTLHIICGKGRYLQYRWAWSTDVSDASNDHNAGIVAVIDGRRVLVTPFHSLTVPPPLCAYTLHVPSFVNHVVWSQSFAGGTECQTAALLVLSDARIAYYSWTNKDQYEESEFVKLEACGGPGFAMKCRLPSFVGYFSLEGYEVSKSWPLNLSHFVWSRDKLLFYSGMGESRGIYLCSVNVDNKTITVENTINCPADVFAVATDAESDTMAVECTDGSVYKLDGDNATLVPWCDDKGVQVVFEQSCTQIALGSLAQKPVVIGLTDRFRLYVDNLQLATNCTSFALHKEFILHTSHAHTIRCISRCTKHSALVGLAEGKAHPFDETVRRVERGSRLVAVPGDTRVVLQMPRGNLETVHPRALVLAAVREALDRLRFDEAFVLMRKHRINMNLLYDHNPQIFLQHVTLFVTQINNVTHVNLFLTDLVEEDVTQTMYTAAYNRDVTTSPSDINATKVDVICDAVRVALKQLDDKKFLLSILTSHVRKSTPELDIALNIVKELKGAGGGEATVAEEALKYMLFLVDVNELYDVALGIYDFQLVLMVAERSQKDPKEYLPFLNQLRKMETNYQKFTIDKHLKRYHKALEHISLCGAEHFEECIAFVKEQRMYAHALDIFPRDSHEHKAVAGAYGDYLSGKGHHEEAGLMYVRSGQHACALDAYTRGLQWQQCLCLCAALRYTPEQIAPISRSLASRLKERRQFIQASCLLEQYAQDSEEAIVTLIEGHQWQEALRMMHKYCRLDIAETHLTGAMSNAAATQLDGLAEQRRLFEKHRVRLDAVRREKLRRRLELYEQGAGGGPDSDLFSDTSSATGESFVSEESRTSSHKSGSVNTRVSGRSGKSRRKGEQKKKWSLKEGSAKEDCALIEALAQLVKQVDQARDEVGPLLRVLVEYGRDREARQLQAEYGSLLSDVERHLEEIWDPEQLGTTASGVAGVAGLGPDSTANAIALAMQQGRLGGGTEEQVLDPILRTAPSLNKDDSWKLNCLEGKSTG